MSERRKDACALAVLGVLCVAWMGPLFGLGENIARTHTFWYDPLRAIGVAHAWSEGLADARWFSGFDRGYGYPFLSFYAPLFHWVSALAYIATGSPALALKLPLLTWLIVGTCGAALATRRVWRVGGAASDPRALMLAGGLAWLSGAYLFNMVYVRGAHSEFASAQMLPWIVFFGAGALGRRGKPGARDSFDALGGAIAVALGILAHNFGGLVSLGVACVMVPLMLFERGSWREQRRVAAWAGAMALALAASAFFWLPAMMERGFVQTERMFEGNFDPTRHLLYWSNILRTWHWGFLSSGPGPGDDMPLHAGHVWFVSLAIGTCAFLRGRADGMRGAEGARLRLVAGLFIAMGVALFMMMSPAATLYRHMDLLKTAQFPWRFLTLPTLVATLLVPACFRGRTLRDGVPLLAGLSVIFAMSMIGYARFREPLKPTEQLDPKSWATHTIRTADIDEYGPVWRPSTRDAYPAPWSIVDSPQVTLLDAEGSRIARTMRMESTASGETTATFAVNYFPGWRAKLNGEFALVEPHEESGFLRVVGIPNGQNELKLEFGDTPMRRGAKALSACALLAWIGLALRARTARQKLS